MELLNSIFIIQSINKNNNNINHNNSSATCVGLSYLQIPFANYRGVIYDAHSVLYPLRGSQLIPWHRLRTKDEWTFILCGWIKVILLLLLVISSDLRGSVV